tara:strand:- start:38 stop:295 length:258 start_codon:yes stop_codon:yes gene_type:complete
MSENVNVNEMAKEVVVDSVKAGLEEGKDVLVAQLKKKSFFDALVRGLNKSIDVPFIGEDTEEKVLRGILNVCISALEEVDFDGED